MGVDQTSLDRIRNATFPSSRRGYDKHEVEKFLARLADWLETGGGDESRSDAVKRELERVGERTGAILSQAQDSAQQIRAEAEEEARSTLNEANATAQRLRSEADAYAAKTRSAIDSEAAEHRDRLDGEVEDALVEAESKARRIVEEGLRRRADIESVITDLVHRRDEVIADVEDLSAKLDAAAAEHRPRGPDPYERPMELDPEVRAEEAGDGPGADDDIDTGEDDDVDTGEHDDELLDFGEHDAGDESDVTQESPVTDGPDVTDERDITDERDEQDVRSS